MGYFMDIKNMGRGKNYFLSFYLKYLYMLLISAEIWHECFLLSEFSKCKKKYLKTDQKVLSVFLISRIFLENIFESRVLFHADFLFL